MDGARLRSRSRPAAGARPSRRSSPQSPRGRRARRRRSEARTSRPRVPLGRGRVAVRESGGVAWGRVEAAVPPAPPDRPEQDQCAPGHPADQDRPAASPIAPLIVKRSVAPKIISPGQPT
ncbi:hypothetical protein BU52_32965 [Streptomyces toyocaensis]|uniref:Uncharacterized protein n=1 Tax=Streptomyces toyocaensis TaxID=55952 RepID=A0A081XHH7_STRTO|nr:hypothetical protein BU52_32965 [Streptomyces toyocaensis]